MEEPQTVSFREAFWTWARVAALSFGGPTGQIAVMHRILVEEKKWISEHRFLHALNYCMLLPGPEATQLATYIGWLLHGTRGGLMAGTLFITPGFIVLLVLSILYAEFQQTAVVAALFFGLKPAVMAIVAEAVVRIGRRVLKNGAMLTIAAAAFVAIFVFELPFPLIILAAGVIGLVGGWLRPDLFHVIKGHAAGHDDDRRPADAAAPLRQRTTLLRTLSTTLSWLAIWFVPLGMLVLIFGSESVFVTEGTFFSQAAVVTFGGAYAVLPYISQQAVYKYGWLQPAEMLDGLGMAETTPGPLIMVVQFVGFIAAYRNPGSLSPLAAGVLGSVVTVWVTFVPCFLWIFVGAPFIEQLRQQKWLSCALSAITAAVVGVVLNLAIWFAVHVLFGTVAEARMGFDGDIHVQKPLEAIIVAGESPPPPSVWQPHVRWFQLDWRSLNWPALVIAIASAVVLFGTRRGMFAALGLGVVLGVAFFVAGLG
jgi:chromate transporter